LEEEQHISMAQTRRSGTNSTNTPTTRPKNSANATPDSFECAAPGCIELRRVKGYGSSKPQEDEVESPPLCRPRNRNSPRRFTGLGCVRDKFDAVEMPLKSTKKSRKALKNPFRLWSSIRCFLRSN
jgi:hypothetical protein